MDSIADMLTTIINAQRIGKKRVAVPHSGFKEELLNLLQKKGLIAKIRTQESPTPKLIVTLLYDENENPAIRGVRRTSKPGRRIYANHASIPYSYDGVGAFVVSTSKGLMYDSEARKQKIGGELICEIW